MSISIRNDGLAESSAAQSSRTSQTTQAARAAQSSSGLSSTGADRVEISSLAEKVAAADGAQAIQHSQHVGRLTALYASGRYQVDSRQVSRALVSQSLSARPAQGAN